MSEIRLTHAWATALDRYDRRRREAISGIVVHRIEVSQEDASYVDTVEDIERFFAQHPVGVAATGGKMPYPIVIDKSGAVYQTVPLCRVTPHARAHNPTTIGVACIGDFRRRAPCNVQRDSLVDVCAALLAELGGETPCVYGHDELAGASADPDKECPGALLSMDELRHSVATRLSVDIPMQLAFVW